MIHDDGYGDVPVTGARPPGTPPDPAQQSAERFRQSPPPPQSPPPYVEASAGRRNPPPMGTGGPPPAPGPSFPVPPAGHGHPQPGYQVGANHSAAYGPGTSPESREPQPGAPAAELMAIGERLDSIDGSVRGFHVRAEQYETIIRKMQSKIEDLQSDQVRTLLKPVISRLANLYTEAMTAAERAAGRGDTQAQKDFGYFADEIEEGLELLDIESLGTRVGDDFNAKIQAASGTVTTDDPNLDRKVAQVIRQGDRKSVV